MLAHRPDPDDAGAQIDLIGVPWMIVSQEPSAVPNGGSARGYYGLFVQQATPGMALQVDGLTVCLCIASATPDVLICRIWRVSESCRAGSRGMFVSLVDAQQPNGPVSALDPRR